MPVRMVLDTRLSEEQQRSEKRRSIGGNVSAARTALARVARLINDIEYSSGCDPISLTRLDELDQSAGDIRASLEALTVTA